MRRIGFRIVLYFSIIFLVVMIILSSLQYRREMNFRQEQLENKLCGYNYIIEKNYTVLNISMDSITILVPDTNVRITILDSVGSLLYDTYPSANQSNENILNLPEFQEVKGNPYGKDVRKSQVNNLDYYYVAQYFDGLYVRSALPFTHKLTESLKVNLFFLDIFALIIIIVIAIVFIISYKLIESMERRESLLKKDLTQNISHELKTPVAAILGYMESIINNPNLPSEKQQYFIERTYHQSHRLVSLLQDISTLNRLNERHEVYEIETVDIVTIIYDIVHDTAEAAAQRNVKISLQLPADLMIEGNKSLIYSIFRNLTDNAISYAGEGTELKIVFTHSDPYNYYFSVRDNGVGVEEEHLPRLFERFYRLDKGRSRKIGGTGLGLAIVKNAILFHRGSISVKKLNNGGLDFLFNLHK